MKDYKEFVEIFERVGHPPFRARQLLNDVFNRGVADFREMKNLPVSLRDFLDEKVPLLSIEEKKVSVTPDGSVKKVLFGCQKDGKKIESVLMRFKDGRRTVCVSSQVGCNVKCKFCATGQMGFKRNLTYEEIADQVLYFILDLKDYSEPITNVVFMGMGEPFNNYEEVMRAVRHLNDARAFNVGARNITLSTSGIVPGILSLIEEDLQVGLAVSLHAPLQDLREELVPIAKKYPLTDLMEATQKYIRETHRRVTYEYVMLAGVNDKPVLAHELGKLLKGQLCHVNLIPYNATDTIYRCSRKKAIEDFKEILETYRVPVTVRVSLGQGIDAACGQLANG
ncbi:MAG: 23S rRNA (adenine(2503)-C(2))-methyltransferase RlmN [Patescibacteria group bacterium]|nr:23S rRNA (adenine(2503)-C(2))-methyltransferase RlmN [Patescibacteria group bacterium]